MSNHDECARAIEAIAMSIAEDTYPDLKLERLADSLDAMAAPFRERFSDLEPGEDVKVLRAVVYGELGFVGCDDYDDPRGSLLSDVLERRTGSPVLMGVVLVALGRRLDVKVEPIAFPGHFLVRVGRAQTYADPMDGAHPLPRQALIGLAMRTLDCDEREAVRVVEPASPSAVGVRILLNLQRIHRQRGDHAHGLLVADRLYELTGAPIHRCDRGLHALALGARDAAIADLEAYLRAHPDARDADAVASMLDEARSVAAVTH